MQPRDREFIQNCTMALDAVRTIRKVMGFEDRGREKDRLDLMVKYQRYEDGRYIIRSEAAKRSHVSNGVGVVE